MVRRTIGFSDYWSFGPMVHRNIGMSPYVAPISTDNYLGSVILLPSISLAAIWIVSVWDDTNLQKILFSEKCLSYIVQLLLVIRTLSTGSTFSLKLSKYVA